MSIEIRQYTKERIGDALDFERRLRSEEDFCGWKIDEAYIERVEKSFSDPAFDEAVSLLAYQGGRLIGRIDSSIIASRFDGSKKAYLDWICVIKSCRHKGVAQKLLEELRLVLKQKGVDTLIALTAANPEAQSFYRNVPDSVMRDTGIWIDIK